MQLRQRRDGWASLGLGLIAVALGMAPVAAAQAIGDGTQAPAPRAKAGPADPDIRQPRPGPETGPPPADLPTADPVERQRAMADVSPERCRREAQQSREIIVCADPEGREKYRIPPKLRDAETSIRDGLPRAPNMDNIDCRTHPGRGVSTGCMSFGKVPPPVYYFDITKLPEPPAGSDADRIAKGELKAD